MIQDGVGWLNLLLFYLSLGVRLFALVDAATRPAQSYVAAGKLTKPAWLIILGVAVAVALLGSGLTGIFNIAGVIAAIVYLVDVRPALRALGPNRPRGGPPAAW